MLTATPLQISFECKAGATPAEQHIRVSGTWPRLAYRLTVTDAAWLNATPEHGKTPREGSAMTEDIVHLRVDAAGLKPDHYSAIVTVSSWQALQPVRVHVTLTVN